MNARPNLRVVPPIDVNGRAAPHDLDAERVLLSDMLQVESARISQIREWLRPEHFYAKAHDKIYQAIEAWDELRVKPDSSLVASWLNDREWLAECGGIAEIRRIELETPTTLNIDEHALIVLRKSQRREMIKIAREISAEGYGDVGDEETWLHASALRLSKIADQFDQAKTFAGYQSASAAVQKAFKQAERKGRITGVTTGLAPIDALTGGLQPTDVTLLTAVSGGGKTALAVNVALAVARSEDDDGELRSGVLVFSLEMPHDQLGSRMVSALGRVDMNQMRTGNFTEYDIRRSVQAAQDLQHVPIAIDDAKNVTMGMLRARGRRTKDMLEAKGQRLSLIVIDYVQLINGRDLVEKGGNRERELAEVARGVVNLAAELNVAILLLAQLNNDGEIRESKAVMHFAHNWWNLTRASDDERAKGGPEPVQVKIQKHRNGPAGGEIELWFKGRFMLFADTNDA